MALPRLEHIDALLLDLDDTILDDRSGIREAWRSAGEFVCSAHPELAEAAVAAAISAHTAWFWSDPERERIGRLDLPAARREILAGVLERLGCPDPPLAEAAARHYTELRQREQRLAAGALEALERLRAALPRLALVTNGAADPQRAKIARFGLAPFFDHIQVEGEFGRGKPEPEVYHHVAEQLRVAPARCLMVGDNFRCDVLGALGAGMRAAWIDVEKSGRGPASLAPGSPGEGAEARYAIVASLVELAERLLGALHSAHMRVR
jgi:putative hydrolase of the HAD superfamily